MILEHVEMEIEGTGEVVTYDVTVDLAQQAAVLMRKWMNARDAMDEDDAQLALLELARQLGEHGPAGASAVALREVARLKVFTDAERAEFDTVLTRGWAALIASRRTRIEDGGWRMETRREDHCCCS